MRDMRRLLAAVLLVSAVLAGLAAVLDGTWLRPLIQHHVQERSGRRIEFDNLRLGLDAAWQPTVRLRNLVVQNASWAAPRPLIRAAELGFTLSWASLAGKTTTLTRLELIDAEFDLERQADGLRNWRLTRPDDRGPGRLRVMSIEARNAHGRVVDGSIGLELELQTTPLAAPMARGTGLPPLTQRLAWQGVRAGKAFSGQFSVSDTLTLQGTGRPFSLQGEWRGGAARATVDGQVADLLQPSRLALDLQLAGPSIADLGAPLGVQLRMPSQPIEASGRLVKESEQPGERWRLSALQLRSGRSELAGELQLERPPGSEGRSMLRGSLTSPRLNLADLRPGPPPPAAAASQPGGDGDNARIDADIAIQVAQVESRESLPLTPLGALTAHAVLRGGRWAIDPIGFAVAGGQASGRLMIDTLPPDPAYALDLQLRGLQLAQLARAAPRLQPLGGAIDLRISMQSQGDSPATLANAAAGSVRAELVRATIPASLDAKLALDGGRLVRKSLGGLLGGSTERTAVTCSALDFRFNAGRGTAHRLAIETPQLALIGSGSVDLGRGTVDIVLTPHRKQAALLSLDRAVQLSGALRAPKVELIDTGRRPQGEACLPGSVQ